MYLYLKNVCTRVPAYKRVILFITRMHSSRMCTARALTVSPSMLCGGQGGSPWGSAPGGVCSSGGLLLGGSTPGGSPPGGSPPGGIPAHTEADPLPVDRILDTCF